LLQQQKNKSLGSFYLWICRICGSKIVLNLYSNYCFCLQCIVMCLLCSVQGLLARNESVGVMSMRVQLASLGLVGVSGL
jgi:hypothetical protein